MLHYYPGRKTRNFNLLLKKYYTVTSLFVMARKKRKACALAPPTADGSYSDMSDVDELMSKSVGNGHETVDKLYAEIDRQREVISLLTTRLNFVLSMFGIKEILAVFDKPKLSTGYNDVEKKSVSVDTLCICII